MSTSKTDAKTRIELIDALRGLAVVLMVLHHALYNSTVFLGAPRWFFSNPVFDALQPFFIGVFVCLSGVSSRFSRSNVNRGAIVLVLAMLVTYVTVRMGMPIYFGILHLLGFLMIFYGLTRKLWDSIPKKVAPFIYVALTVVAAVSRVVFSPSSNNPVVRDLLSVLGWRQRGFVSHDYQPILPMIFVFLFGTWAGYYIRERKFPQWFYEAKFPFLPLVGRNALLIYMAHQPILYGITMLVANFIL